MTWGEVLEGIRLNWLSLVAAMAIAAMCAYVGVYVVLKRIVFVGASLAQISSAGIGLAFMLGATWPFAAEQPFAISLVITLLGTLLFSQQTLSWRLPQESVIGLGYLVAYALMIMFVAKSPNGLHEVEELIAGSIITVTVRDFYWMLGIFAAIATVLGLAYKQILFVSFDRDVAATQGYQVRAWELLFYLVLGVVISVSIQKAGLLLVFGYLVIPALSGLVVARRMSTAFLVSMGTALIATFAGFCWALKSDLPTSPPIIAVSAILLAALWVSRRFVKES